MKKRKTVKKRYVIALVIVIAGLITLWRILNAPVPTYQTLIVRPGDLQQSVLATGKLDALRKVDVGAQVSGQLKTLSVAIGDKVKKDQLLGVIDPEQAENQIKEVEATLMELRAQRQQAEAELKLVEDKCRQLGVNVALSEVWGKGGEGGIALAEEVVRLCEEPNDFHFTYELDCSIREKLQAIAHKIYHADDVKFLPAAEKEMKQLEDLGFGNLPICVAKTQYSFSDDQSLLGAPRGFDLTVRNLKVSAGAGFIVALTGNIMTMPGLPKKPAAENIDVDASGKITGLF